MIRLTLAALLLATPALAQTITFTPPYKPVAPTTPATTGDIAEMKRALHNDLAAILAQLKAAPVATSATTAPASSTAAANPFPADPGLAPFPSPENASIIRLADKVSGAPYVRDVRGSVHTLGAPTTGKSGYFINGVEVTAYEGARVVQILMRGGEAYVQLAQGNWQHADPGMGNGLYNTGLPDTAAAASTSSGTQTAATPAAVMPSAIAPGSSGRVLTVGKDCADLYACVKASADGDTVDGAGQTLPHSLPLIATSIEIRNATVECSSSELTYGKGCAVNDKDVTYRNVNVRMNKPNPAEDSGVGCIRPNSSSTVRVFGGTISGCPQGVAGGGFPWALEMTDTILDGNGRGDGFTHNIYVSGGATRVSLTRITSRNPRGGHAVKSRAAAFSCVSCVLSSDETVIDLPNGTSSVATVTDSTLTKTPGTGNHRLIGYGEEGASVGTAGMLVTGGTVTGLDNPFIQGTGTVTFRGTAVVGQKPVGQGVTVVGP